MNWLFVSTTGFNLLGGKMDVSFRKNVQIYSYTTSVFTPHGMVRAQTVTETMDLYRQSTVRKKMAAVHFTTISFEPN